MAVFFYVVLSVDDREIGSLLSLHVYRVLCFSSSKWLLIGRKAVHTMWLMVAAWAGSSTHDVTVGCRLSGKQYSRCDCWLPLGRKAVLTMWLLVAAWAKSSTHDVTVGRRLSGKQYSALDHSFRVLGKPLIHQNHKDGCCLFHIFNLIVSIQWQRLFSFLLSFRQRFWKMSDRTKDWGEE